MGIDRICESPLDTVQEAFAIRTAISILTRATRYGSPFRMAAARHGGRALAVDSLTRSTAGLTQQRIR